MKMPRNLQGWYLGIPTDHPWRFRGIFAHFRLNFFGSFCRYDQGPTDRSGRIGSRYPKFGWSSSDSVRGFKRTRSDNVYGVHTMAHTMYGLRRKRTVKLIESGSFKGRKGNDLGLKMSNKKYKSRRWIPGYLNRESTRLRFSRMNRFKRFLSVKPTPRHFLIIYFHPHRDVTA